ncbi:MAG: PA14 domain-containing protein [Candidatus Saccharibacteria bacterium]|nr:PA14 domain-containing protein [Candidatus Saccharibacteria bacterium]
MKHINFHYFQRGQTIIEVLITIALTAIMLPALLTSIIVSREGRAQTEEHLLASGLVQESVEVLRSVREENWDNISTNGTYHIASTSTGWSLMSGAETVDGYTKSIVIEDAYRDDTGTILEADPDDEITTCTPTGNARFEKYDNISGTAISQLYDSANFPDNPTSTQSINDTVLTTPINIDDNFGGRLSALLCAPEDGNYIFYVNGDDGTELRISADTDPANVSTIASVDGWTNAGEWNKYTSQTSAPVTLNAGQYYYIEANYKEAGGGDHAQIGWRLPNNTTQRPISNTHYSLPNEANEVYTTQTSPDASTKKITVSVEWTTPRPDSISTTFYFSRYENDVWEQISHADFASGSFNGTTASFDSGGSVTLATGQTFDWEDVSTANGYNTPGNTDGYRIYADSLTERIYLSTGATLYIFSVQNPTNPSLLGSYGAGSQINGIHVDGDHTYLATSGNTTELQIVDVSNPNSPSLTTNLNLGGTTDATNIHVVDGYAYVSQSPSTAGGACELCIVDISDPVSPSISGGYDTGSNINSLYYYEEHVYVAIDNTAAELAVLNVSNKNNPTVSTYYNAPGTIAGNAVFVADDTVYFGRFNYNGGQELYTLSTDGSSLSLLDALDLGRNVNSIHKLGDKLLLALSGTNPQIRVIDVADPSNISQMDGTGIGGNTANQGVFFGNYGYIASSTNNSELTVVVPSITGSGFEEEGEYISPTFDSGSTAGYNYLSFQSSQPPGTTLRLQVAANNDNATWDFIGPDGTPTSYYTDNNSLPFDLSGRYFRYRLLLTGPGDTTSALENITINYSP